MKDKDGKFEVYDYGCSLTPGQEIKLEYSISPYCTELKNEIEDLLLVDDLQNELKERLNREQEIYDWLKGQVQQWVEAAKRTQLCQRALEFKDAEIPKHTNNKWAEGIYRDMRVRSNAVYTMDYSIRDDTEYNHKTKEREVVAWHVTWDVSIRGVRGYSQGIAGQRQKRFTDKEKAIQYLEGRVKAFNHLFTEEYPPIPKEYETMFMVSGMLLPGYKISI